ncbi:MAG: Plug domain-containing protein, partial [Sphingobium sp.]
MKLYLLCGTAMACLPLTAMAETPETAQTPAAAETSTAQNQSPAAVSPSDIIVTAQRRAQRLVDVPISVNVVDAEELNSRRIDSLFDLTKSVTSLRFEGQFPAFMPTLRGIGTLVLGGGVDASVAVYVDGVYLPNSYGMGFNLPNIESVQVLKGPQGTLFGRN